MKAAIITLLFSGSLSLAGTPISFQRLPAGDSIFATVTSSGCFHHYTHEFIFSHGATFTAKVTQVEHRWNEALKRQEEAKRIPLGTATLSEIEVAGLDRLFRYYRSMKRGGCTTVEQITAVQKSGDTTKADESFTDATCKTYDMKNVTRLAAIAGKLKPKAR